MLTACLFLGFAVTIASAARYQMWEKESQNGDMMQVMGMQHSVIWLVWILISTVNMLIISITLTVILKLGGLLPNSDTELVFLLLLLYSFSCLAFW